MGEVSAHSIREALRVHFPAGAFAVLEEVRNQTGYQRHQQRYADAMVCSCWPSRGIWIAGVEIKVDRADWMRELKDPAKSAEIQQWCDYWWIAAPTGIVRDGELPVTWGLLEYDANRRGKDKLAVKVSAPKLESAPVSIAFIASIMRSAAAREEAITRAAVNEATRALLEELSTENVEAMKGELARLRVQVDVYQNERRHHQAVSEELAQLKHTLGIRWHGTVEDATKALQRAKALDDARCAETAATLREVADRLDGIGVSDG